MICEICVKKIIYEVDFAALLVSSSVELQEIGDAERVLEGIELRGLLEHGEPLLVGFAGLVGVWKDHYFVVHQGGKEFWLEHLEATAGHPETLRTNDTHDNCRFL